MKKLLIGGLLAIPLLAAVKKCRIMQHLSGKTEAEARDVIIAKATPKVGPEKAGAIAGRIVARLAVRGLLAPEPAAG